MKMQGAKAMIPVTTGIIPFGLIMGTVSANAQLSEWQTVGMNFIVFAGAAQLAAIDLMTRDAETFVIIFTGLVINLRFILYSAALSQSLKNEGWIQRTLAAYCITDQSYAVLMAHIDKLGSTKEKLQFYFGASILMIFCWQSSVYLGFLFGNFAPAEWSLDFAIPLSFAALVIPTLKHRVYIYVALTAALLSVLFKHLPYNLGLLIASLSAIVLGAYLTRTVRAFK